MALHKDLVEGELHEVKGASTASADQVLVSNGTGSTTFKKITTSNIDLTNIKNLNKSYLSFIIIDPYVAFDIYLPIPATIFCTRSPTLCKNFSSILIPPMVNCFINSYA